MLPAPDCCLSAPARRLPADGLIVDDRRLWWKKSGGRPSTYRRSMWRMSNAKALIFIAVVAIAVALLALA